MIHEGLWICDVDGCQSAAKGIVLPPGWWYVRRDDRSYHFCSDVCFAGWVAVREVGVS